MPRKPFLSPTRLSTYLECPVEYRYVYVDRIGRFYRRPRPGYSFGATLHNVLRGFHSATPLCSADELVARLDGAWISAGYESAEQERTHRDLAEQILREYHGRALRREAAGIETLWVEHRVTYDAGDLGLEGRLDRVDRHPDGTLEIVDYKSGRDATSQEDLDADLAMRVYQLILMRQVPESRIVATIHALRTGQETTTELANADSFEAEVLGLARETLTRDLSAVPPSPIPACEVCDFRRRCWGANGRVPAL